MGKGEQNRPYKFGAKDRREFIVQDSEVGLVAINDTNGNPIFLGRAKIGIGLAGDKWQIRRITYDSVQGVTRITWPLNVDNLNSSDYEFVWSSVTNLTITDITQANPGVVTVSALGSLTNGDRVAIQDVVGMTEVNFSGENLYVITNINVGLGTFELLGINTTTYTAYVSDGTVTYGEVVNYTYS